MKKFSFKLEKLLDFKRTVEEQKLTELAVIRAEHGRELSKLLEFMVARDGFQKEMKKRLSDCDAEKIKEAQKYLEGLHHTIQTQENSVACIVKQKDEKTGEVLDAAKERKSLERLREHKQVAYKREVEHQEQKFLDDIACIRGGRRHHEIGHPGGGF